MSSQNMTPSLKIWLIALLIGIILAVLFHLNMPDSKYFTFEDYIKKQYQTFSMSADSSKRKVIIVGNSLTRCAVPYLQGNMQCDFNYFRIVRDGFNLTDFIPLITDLTKYHPDFIVIATDLMFSNFDPKPDTKFEYLRYISFDDKLKFRKVTYFRFNSSRDDEKFNKLTKRSIDLEAKMNFLEEYSKVEEDNIVKIKEFIDLLNKKNIGIIFLDLPRSESLSKKLSTSDIFVISDSTANQISRNKGIRRLTVVRELPDSLYLDFSHLNKQGRAIFSQLFFNKMDSLMAVAQ